MKCEIVQVHHEIVPTEPSPRNELQSDRGFADGGEGGEMNGESSLGSGDVGRDAPGVLVGDEASGDIRST